MNFDKELDARGLSCPFDVRRDGFVVGEGAAVVILAAARGSGVVELAGEARTLDAHHLPRPPEGAGAERAMRGAPHETSMDGQPKRMAIIASKGALDMAYPPLILASTAAALDYEVQVFFTFYGLTLLRKNLSDVKISPLGNPAMPMPLPMPVLVALPGMETWRRR